MKQFKLTFLVVSLMMILSNVGWGQSTIFTESMGTVAATTTIAAHETANGFDNDGYTMTNGGATNPADIRQTSVSSGYTGASGLANVFFTSTNAAYGFAIEGINASTYTNLTVQFGYRKESGTALPTLALDYWDGSAWVNVPFAFNEATNAAIGWYLSPIISLPIGAQISTLKLRWVKSGTNSVRIDDVILKGSAPPLITVGSISTFGNQTVNTTSSEKSYTVSGSNLGTNSISIVPPAGFEISTGTGGSFVATNPITLNPTSGTVASTTIYVRFKPTAVLSYSGNINHTSTGATMQPVAVSGTGTLASSPTIQTTSIIFNNVTAATFDIGWSTGDGLKRAVFMREGSGSIINPINGTDYSASNNWNSGSPSGTQLGSSGYYCIYNGSSNAVSITGLNSASTYYVQAFEYNGSGASANYYTVTGTGNPNNQTTNSASAPLITVGTISGFGNQTINTYSSEKSYAVSGSNLTADIVITPPVNFEISTTSGSGFVSNPGTITLTKDGSGNVTSTTIYVRFKPTALTTYSSNITHTSSGSNNPIVAVSGTGISDLTSKVVTPTSQIVAGDISSLTTSSSSPVSVFNFKIIDLGSGDGLVTKVTAVKISTIGTANLLTVLGGAQLFDGISPITTGTPVITATDITFPIVSGNLNISDASSKDITLEVYLKTSGITDNQTMIFQISQTSHGFIADASGSGFASDFGAAVTGNTITLRVEATKINFVQQPTNIFTNMPMAPAVNIEATDANNNRDLDKTGTVSVVSSGTMTGPVSATLSNGFGTFGNIVHTDIGTSLVLTASLSGFADATSGTFNVTSIAYQDAGLLLFEDNFSYSNALTSNLYTAISAGGTNTITANATGLIYPNYGSSNIGNAISLTTSGEDDSKSFGTQSSPNTIYASFLVKISATQSGDYVFALAPSAGTSTFRSRFFIKSSVNTGFINFGIANSSTGTTYGTTDFALNTTHLIVIKYSFTSNVSATASVFVNPDLYSEPGASEVSVTDNTAANAPADITSFTIRQGTAANAPTLVMDGIRIGTGWGAVLGNPQYNTNSNINAGNYNNVVMLSNNLTLTGNVTINGTLYLTNGIINSTASNKLTLGSSASISGGSSTSFVSGPLAKICNSTSEFTFHVGKGSSYLPLGIIPTTTANVTTYEAEYFNTPYTNTTAFGTSGLAGVSLNGYHELSRPSGTVPAVLRIYWDANSGVITTNDLRVAHWNSSLTQWENLGYSGITGGPSGGNLLTNASVSSFSPFALGTVSNQPMPVNLSSLSSSLIGRNIKLNWTTASEINNSGFNVERMNVAENNWSKVTFVSGHGTMNTPTNYSFEDRNLQTGKYKYRLKQIDVNGNFEYFALNGEIEVGVPKKFDLSQNYPNPFNPTTKINFDLPADSKVTMLVYDITGREIARLVNNEYKKAGYYTTDFNAGMLSSGVYFYSLSADNFRMTKKMVVLK